MENEKARLTVEEAAKALRISTEAVRSRIRRGSLESERDEAGHVYVRLIGDEFRPNTDQLHDQSELVEALRERISSLEAKLETRDEEIRRRDHLLAAAFERIPALSEKSEARESPVRASEEGSRGTDRKESGETDTERTERPWWQRIFQS